jgi:hypothetical protein
MVEVAKVAEAAMGGVAEVALADGCQRTGATTEEEAAAAARARIRSP